MSTRLFSTIRLILVDPGKFQAYHLVMKQKPSPVIAPETPFPIGYARVSTRDQNLDLQIDALKAAGVQPDNLHVEKLSATAKKRPMLDEAIHQLRPGDVLIVWRLDRLARNMRELYTRLEQIHANGASFKSLTETFDFTTATGKLVLGFLGLMAEFERQLTVERTIAGIKAARDRGLVPGMKPKLDKDKAALAFKMLTKGGKTVPEVAKHFGVVPGTIYNYFRFERDAGGNTYVSLKPRKK